MAKWKSPKYGKGRFPLGSHITREVCTRTRLLGSGVTRCQARCYLFCDLLSYVLPDHGHLPHEAELRRMAVECFSKPFDTWRDEKAPVHGQHFLGYYDAGAAMLKALP